MARKDSVARPPQTASANTTEPADGDRDPARIVDLPGRTGSRGLIRDLNVSLLIELVRRLGPVCRADLARVSQLSAPTVSAIVRHLLDRGIFSEVAVAPSSGGRPPILLQLESKAGYVVGIKLRGDGLTTVLCDLDGQVVVTQEAPVALVGRPGAAIDAVDRATRGALRAAGVSRSRVLGVGIGLSGVIDSHHGTCKFSHLLGWQDVELAAPLRRKLQTPVWVDNDVNTLAVAEKWWGDDVSARNFVTLSIGRGIGLGIVIDRSLYRGAGGAGELGHSLVDPEGPQCECGRFGCLEALVGEAALRRRVGEVLGRAVSRDQLVALAQAGDPACNQVLESAGRQLGRAVANVVTLLSPELLIVCGEGVALGDPLLVPTIETIREEAFAGLGRQLEVKVQSWGNDAWAVGAATLALRELFDLPAPDDGTRPLGRSPARRFERADLVETSVGAILSNQQPNGALIASPDFPEYKYCWLRDGAFVAHALDRAGELEASARFHAWVTRALEGAAAAMDAAVARSRGGSPLDPTSMSPARFSLDGAAVADDWPNFQIDGYGIWLWALRSHLGAAGTKRVDGPTLTAVERTARYLDALALTPCFDVWEEDGASVHTSTLACIYGGLVAAAEMLDDRRLAVRAAEVRRIVLEQGERDGCFAKSSSSREVDASLLWLSAPFDLVDPTQAVFAETASHIVRDLEYEGGVRRYPGDTYFGGGAWALLTASLGWHYSSIGDLPAARRQLEWIAARYDDGGRLGEQFGGERRDPEHYRYWVARWGPPARELLWSHAMFVILSNEIALAAARPADAGPAQEQQPLNSHRKETR